MLELAIGKMTTPQQSDDLILLKRIAMQEEEALSLLYSRHGNKLYGYALRIVRNPVLAEDVLQESLLAIWQGAKHFRKEGQVLAWMFGIVHNKAMRTFRHKPTSQLDESTKDPAILEHQVDERLLSEQRGDRLHIGLNSLSVEHRTVLELVFYQGMKLKEVAEICDIPVGTVKSRLKYAKDALKGAMTRQSSSMEEIK